MNKLKTALVACLFLFSMSVFAVQNPQGQEGQGAPEHHGHMGPGHGMPSVDDQVNEMSKKLNLSDDQKSQVKNILQDTHQQMQTLMSDNSLSREDKMQKMRDLHQSAMGKVRDLLNDDQKKKFDAWEQEREQHMKNHHGGDHDHDKGSTSPQ